MQKAFLPVAAFALAAALLSPAGRVQAASHRDAPGQLGDPDVNLTDVYAWVTPGNTLTMIWNVHPSIDPAADGPIWTYPSPDVLYSIWIENDGKMNNGAVTLTGKPQIEYDLRFSPPAYRNPGTILTEGRGTGLDAGPIMDVGDAHQNLIQTYTVTEVNVATGVRTDLAGGKTLLVAPPNVGPRATPFYNDKNGLALPGATSTDTLDRYTKEASYDLGGGRRIFAGQREDPFYFDQGGTFDLLNLRKPGIDTFAGQNVISFVLQVPISDVVATGGVPVVGVYSTSGRRQVTVRRGSDPSFSAGKWQVVSRMGNPLFNEAFVALEKKDKYNQTTPDGDEEYRTYAENPELAILANAVLLSSADPVKGPIPTSGRTDLSGIFIPDLLKVDLSTPAPPMPGQAGYSRLGVFGGDVVKSAFQNKMVPSGWPNGRRPGDDVIDIALTALASPTAGSGGTITAVGDNVDSNDVTYPTVFPYLGIPHSAFNHKLAPPPATP